MRDFSKSLKVGNNIDNIALAEKRLREKEEKFKRAEKNLATATDELRKNPDKKLFKILADAALSDYKIAKENVEYAKKVLKDVKEGK